MKKYEQIKILLLILLLFISPALWMTVGNIPLSFEDSQSWIYLMTFTVLAFAVYVALDSNNKK